PHAEVLPLEACGMPAPGQVPAGPGAEGGKNGPPDLLPPPRKLPPADKEVPAAQRPVSAYHMTPVATAAPAPILPAVHHTPAEVAGQNAKGATGELPSRSAAAPASPEP